MKVALTITPILFAASALHAQPVQWITNGHYYEVVSSPLAWESARSAAESMSWLGVPGHLVAVTSLEENLFLTQTFGAKLEGAWLGGFQPVGSPEPGGGWQWITGEAFDYTGWFPGEPNNIGNENVIIYAHDPQAWGKPWNDTDGSIAQLAYVVEYPVPAPATVLLLAAGTAHAARRRR